MSDTIKYPRLILALGLGFLLALTGCPGDNGDNGDNGNGEDPCVGISCPAGETCIDGVCVAEEDECTVDADCGDATLECRNGDCIAKCQGISCPAGQACEPSTGNCIEEPCTADSDCDNLDYPNGNSEVCVAGECLGTLNSECVEVDCISELDCVTLQYQDGSSQSSCKQPCTDSGDCPELSFFCADMGTGTYCDQNLCGTDPLFNTAGYTTTTWSGPCNVDGQGDGTCVGPIVAQQQGGIGMLEIGLCFGGGDAVPGATCNVNATHGDAQACDGGICNAPEGAVQGQCLAFCTLVQGQTCDAIDGTPQACTWIGIGRAGVCVPQAATPAAYGETCDDNSQLLECVDDHLCAALETGAAATCISWCNLLSPSCPTGETCFGFEQGEDLLGICATQ